MRYAVHDGVASAAAHADEFLPFELDFLLAHGTNQYLKQFWVYDFLRHDITYTLVVYSFPYPYP